MCAVLEGYEPKEPDCAVMARSLSLPCSRVREAVDVNPFYSERLQQELVLQANRPGRLPAANDVADEGGVPLMHEGRQATGKGQGGDVAGLFTTTQSLDRSVVFGPQPSVMQSQGAMPVETPPTVQQTMGTMHGELKQDESGNDERTGLGWALIAQQWMNFSETSQSSW